MQKNSQTSDKRSFSREGFLLADAILAKIGPLPYSRGELDMQGEPTRIFHLNKTKSAMEAALPSFVGAPITIDHPDSFLDPSNSKFEVVGAVASMPTIDAQGNVRASIRIFDQEAIEKIKAGEDQLSPGFDFIMDKKHYNNDHGDIKEMVVNHVAIVKEGRAGPPVRILDHLPKHDEVKKMPDNDQLQALTAELRKALDVALSQTANTNKDLSGVKSEIMTEVMGKMKPAIDSLQKLTEHQEVLKAAADAEKAKEENKKAIDAAVESARIEERNRFAVFTEAMNASDGRLTMQELIPLSNREILTRTIGDAYPVTDGMSDEILFGIVKGLTRARDAARAQGSPAGGMLGVPNQNLAPPIMHPHQYPQPNGWMGPPPPQQPVPAPAGQVGDARPFPGVAGVAGGEDKYAARFNSTFGGVK